LERGHGGSVRDPYNTMRLYQTATEVIPGLPGSWQVATLVIMTYLGSH
jgi:hypothetical protein